MSVVVIMISTCERSYSVSKLAICTCEYMFPCLAIWFKHTRLMILIEQEMLTIPEHVLTLIVCAYLFFSLLIILQYFVKDCSFVW